ncbi:MAG: TonB-dependent receptor plug domain-containing protein [Raineya sp.]|nr:TonB-dependent receptor plug domain-containing protein [Raineya sp.]
MKYLYLYLWLFVGQILLAQTPDSSRFKLFHSTKEDIENLLQKAERTIELEVEIASKQKQAIEEAPSIISVVTREDIENYGFRDITDILRLVPGFEYAIDVQSLFGIGFRGMWGHEGKVLVMIDNHPINCFGYGNTNFFGHLPVNVIERIEIIRGPGSALYGTFAEAAVINIITKTGKTLQGVEMALQGGAIKNNAIFGSQASAGYNDLSRELDVSANIAFSYHPISAQTYEDFWGNTVELGSKNSWRHFQNISTKLSYKNFYFGFNRMNQRWVSPDEFTTIFSANNQGFIVNKINHFMEGYQVGNKFKISERFYFNPRFEYARGNPITSKEVPASNLDENYSTICQRFTPEITLQYTGIKNQFDFGGGFIANTVTSFARNGTPAMIVAEGDSVTFVRRDAFYVFGQYIRKIEPFVLSLGGRYENTFWGNAFAPRAALNYIAPNQKIYAKLLYGEAFRVPLIWQVYSAQYFTTKANLTPELSRTFEFEIGYKQKSHFRISTNFFLININTPIVYLGSLDTYVNYGNIRSVGAELNTEYKSERLGTFGNISYTQPLSEYTTADFLASDRTHFLALPALKVNGGIYYDAPLFTFSTYATFIGERYAQTQNFALNSNDTNPFLETQAYPSVFLQNIQVKLKKLFVNNLQIGLQVHNIWNAPYVLLQPYYGSHAPFPIQDRQWFLEVKYKF